MSVTSAGDPPNTVGSTVVGTAQPTTAPPTSVPATERSVLETAALANELVEVSGYRYADVSAEELTREAAGLPDWVTAASFHDVVEVVSGAEVGRLVFLVFPPDNAALAPANAEGLATLVLGTSAVTRGDYSGHEVWLAEDPAQSARHVQYVWTRHGAVGGLGAPDRGVADTFLTAYFMVPSLGVEAPILAVRVVDVPGFGYTNGPDDTVETNAVVVAMPGATGALHYVFDSTHMFAGLMLAGPVAPGSAADLTGLVRSWLHEAYDRDTSMSLDEVGTTLMGGTEVLQLRCPAEGMHIFVWYWPATQVVGWMLTAHPDLARGFLTAFHALQRSAG
jgi:hypothetical protein